MEYRRQTHAVYHTRYHLVFSTKFRRKLLKDGMGRYRAKLVKGIECGHPEIHIIEVNTDEDHIHILCSIAPKLSVAQAAGIIKANTAREMKVKFPFLVTGYFDQETIWSIGYFVSTVVITESIVQRYIAMQGKEDSGQAKLAL